MAIDVRTRSITSLPSGGRTITGSASNGKAVVVGDIDITTYTSGGEPVTAADLGLTTIDALFISVIDVDGSNPAANNILEGNYVRATNLLLLTDGTTNVDATSNAQLRFVAFGDSATPELT